MISKWEHEVQTLQHLASEKKSMQEIGDIYGVSRERIRQIFQKYKLTKSMEFRKKEREIRHYQKHGDKTQYLYEYKKKRFANKRHDAIVKGIEFSISFGDLVWPDKCPVLGIPLVYNSNGRVEGSPSLDRIDPKKGYIPGNVFIISWRANRIKNDGTSQEHINISKYMKKTLD